MHKKIIYRVLLEELISVSFKDQFIGSIDKWTAHANQYINSEGSMPHRAFSIFLFNSQNKLLFQRRSSKKKTFPLCWTNTCCSHPNMIEFQNKQKGVEPIELALHRALDRELKMDLTSERLYFVDKILYKALGQGKQGFGQYELDYIFICKLKTPDIKHELVQKEICELEWVARKELASFISEKYLKGCNFSPWFSKIKEHGLLENWWQNVQQNNMFDAGTKEQVEVRNCL